MRGNIQRDCHREEGYPKLIALTCWVMAATTARIRRDPALMGAGVLSGRSDQHKMTGFTQAPGLMPIWQDGSAAWICGMARGARLGMHEAGATIPRSRVESRELRCRRWVLGGEARKTRRHDTSSQLREVGRCLGQLHEWHCLSQARSTGVPLGSVGKERGGKLGTTCTSTGTEANKP